MTLPYRRMPLPAPTNASVASIQRVRWLGHPALFVCVVLLLLNDHVLKDRFPGWWTGKLSDFAGLAVVGVVLAALGGAKRGLVVAGASFGLLKVVPGVAEFAAPLLGGTTRRDATDLIALMVLLPLWLALRPSRLASDACSQATTAPTQGIRTRLRVALATVAPIVGIVLAAAATTATSCGPRPAVVVVTAEGEDLYALVVTGAASERWARSDDGGRTWQGSEPPAAPSTPSTTGELYEDPGPTGSQAACTADGTCWRLRNRRSIERVAPDNTAVEEFLLRDADFSDITTGCAGGSIGILTSITTAELDGKARLAASLGADGVLVRHDGGSWEKVRVLSAPPVEANRAESTASTALLLFGPTLALVVWLVGRRRWPSWRTALAVTAAGWLATIMVAGAIGFLAGPDTDETRIIGLIAVPGIIFTTAAAISVARRPARERPPRRPPNQFPPPSPPPTGLW